MWCFFPHEFKDHMLSRELINMDETGLVPIYEFEVREGEVYEVQG